MKLLFIAILVAAILLVSCKKYSIGEHLEPEDAWKLYNSIKRPPQSEIKISEKELNMR
jgi:hypothetical protein